MRSVLKKLALSAAALSLTLPALAVVIVSGVGAPGTASSVLFQYGTGFNGSFSLLASTGDARFAAAGTAVNVDKVTSYGPVFQYSDPFGGSNWVSAYYSSDPVLAPLDGGGTPSIGPNSIHPTEPASTDGAVVAIDQTFAYSTTFTLGAPGTFTVAGNLLSDDGTLGATIDSTPLTLTPLFVSGDITGPFVLGYSVTGSLPLSAGSHTLTFFVLNNNKDRTASDFSVSVTPNIIVIPEPGTIAFGTILSGSILGLMVRARRNRAA